MIIQNISSLDKVELQIDTKEQTGYIIISTLMALIEP